MLHSIQYMPYFCLYAYARSKQAVVASALRAEEELPHMLKRSRGWGVGAASERGNHDEFIPRWSAQNAGASRPAVTVAYGSVVGETASPAVAVPPPAMAARLSARPLRAGVAI